MRDEDLIPLLALAAVPQRGSCDMCAHYELPLWAMPLQMHLLSDHFGVVWFKFASSGNT